MIKMMRSNKAKCGLLSNVIVAFCLLPATFVYYGDVKTWFQSLTRKKAFFSDVYSDNCLLKKKVEGIHKYFSFIVKIGYAMAKCIKGQHGLCPALHTAYNLTISGNIIKKIKQANNWGLSSCKIVTGDLPASNRILVADYRIPRGSVSAGELASIGIMRDLVELGFQVDFIPHDMAYDEEHAIVLINFGVHIVSCKNFDGTYLDYIIQHGFQYSKFYLIRIDVAEQAVSLLRQTSPSATVIFHAPDVYHIREIRAAEIENNLSGFKSALRTKERELNVFNSVDYAILVSNAEKEQLKHEIKTPLHVIQALYTDVAECTVAFAERKNIFFLGGYGHRPNVDAVIWFAKNIWPNVYKKLPDAEFHIIGAEAPRKVLILESIPGVRVRGFIQDLLPELSKMRISIAPLRFGAGIKGKIGMAMGAGVPCVCTSIAAEGMHIVPGDHALVSDIPSKLAAYVVELYKNEVLWNSISASGKRLVKEQFSAEANRQQLAIALWEMRCVTPELRKFITGMAKERLAHVASK